MNARRKEKKRWTRYAKRSKQLHKRWIGMHNRCYTDAVLDRIIDAVVANSPPPRLWLCD